MELAPKLKAIIKQEVAQVTKLIPIDVHISEVVPVDQSENTFGKEGDGTEGKEDVFERLGTAITDLSLTVNRNDLVYLLCQPLTSDLINRLADHITRFFLSGINAVGK